MLILFGHPALPMNADQQADYSCRNDGKRRPEAVLNLDFEVV